MDRYMSVANLLYHVRHLMIIVQEQSKRNLKQSCQQKGLYVIHVEKNMDADIMDLLKSLLKKILTMT